MAIDLPVRKIARFANNDKEDIVVLVRLGLITADEIEQRATSALAGYVGGQAMLRLNLQTAVALVRQVEMDASLRNPNHIHGNSGEMSLIRPSYTTPFILERSHSK